MIYVLTLLTLICSALIGEGGKALPVGVNRVGSTTMSQLLINQYLNDLDRYKKISGSITEGVISEAFKDLLKHWSRQSNLTFINQYEFVSKKGNRIRPDGTILHDLRVPLGYWEAKDTSDDLDDEIAKKQAKGYPQDNIIYEDSHSAVLIQNGHEVARCEMLDTAALLRLVTSFFKYERQEIADFRKAVQQFKTDIPAVLEALREKIDQAYNHNADFKATATKFLDHAKNTINPSVGEADVREMLIQHILTEEIFAHVFDQGDFHRENNIAKELYALEAKFFTGQVKRETLKSLETYYSTIRSNAALITSHAEKQTFLKVIYENFYKVYNPKAADRLGVVYTPNEIVKFMIEGADWQCQKHFGKSLIDKDVEILDPATGTGTFICELLEHFRGQPQKLAHKYKHELHANEVAILPYYVANLNIEATYAAISGQFAEFPNLCFVDTLDNTAGLSTRIGQQVGDLFGAMSEENVERVQRQNKRKISIVIGNPPYNANQANENDNNKNREYRHIDAAIKATYIKKSTAHKTKLYDMYARFFRWASDRMNDDGVLAFITNRSFVDSRTFDGFRKIVAEEFNEIYVMDLGGDVRANPKLSGTKHNVFGIQTGVAISFFVKRHKHRGCKIFYARRPEMETAEDKIAFLGSTSPALIQFEHITPNSKSNWLNQSTNDFETLLPLALPKLSGKADNRDTNSIFDVFSFGVVTARDEWVYAETQEDLTKKISFYIQTFNESLRKIERPLKLGWEKSLDYSIKWSQDARKRIELGAELIFDSKNIISAAYRPFFKQKMYYSKDLCWSVYQVPKLFLDGRLPNPAFSTMGDSSGKPFFTLAINNVPDLNFVSPASGGSRTFSAYKFVSNGERVDNITDWGLKQFQSNYKKQKITKDDIFHYVYGVLHDPVYREKYAINLKREFPRIPFYPDFKAWADWGKRLMELHIGYEAVEPWPLERIDSPVGTSVNKAILKADKDNGTIRLDGVTTLKGVPNAAWEYRLGNRSGLEWILDQYKEKKPKDPTIAAKFNTYRFADYKEKVIDLLARVTRVSVETMEIVEAMKTAKRDA
jgi:predicted helicase